jgi:hypothetical protein
MRHRFGVARPATANLSRNNLVLGEGEPGAQAHRHNEKSIEPAPCLRFTLIDQLEQLLTLT